MAERKKALGRGLDALFGEMQSVVPANPDDTAKDLVGEGITVDAENMIQYVGIDDIRPNKMQPRQDFDLSAIDELADSIELHGVIQPVILRKTNNGYEMVAGERRWRAARKAGLKKIPAIIRNLADDENALVALIENMQRKDLNAMEEAKAFKTIIDRYEMTQESLAKAVGKSRPYIANTLRIMKLPKEVVKYISEGKLTLGHANAIGAIKDKDVQIKIAEKIATEGLSVRAAEKLCSKSENETEGERKNNKVKAKSREIRQIEDDLTSALGTKVVINDNGRSGSIELKYFDRSGLNDLIDMLGEVKRK